MIPRPRLKPVKERNPVAVAVAGLLLLALVAALAFNVERLPLVGDATTYSADFSEAAGLDTGDEVRIAGVKVGKVTEVSLDGAKVKVTFEVGDAWVGDRSTAAIAIKTLLGEKYLALDPLGSDRQDPGTRIPQSRTTSPYDVTQAFQDLGGTVDAIDTARLAESFETISDTFKNSPPHVRNAATGLSELSRSVSRRDTELARLLANSRKFTKTLETKKSSFETLIEDGVPCSENSRSAATPSAPSSRAAGRSAPNSAASSATTTDSSAPPSRPSAASPESWRRTAAGSTGHSR